VGEYEASGLSRKAFCAERGLAVATLDKYRIRVRQTAAPPRLLAVDVRPAVDVKATNSRLVVVLGNGRRIEVGDRIDAILLAEMIGIAERS
jgi:hypothetical protein